jgi:protein-tyrosine-phosphatase
VSLLRAAGALGRDPREQPHLLFLCTGNATRSVLAGALVAERAPHVSVATAGTFVVDGQPISVRTRAAFEAIDLRPPQHRSRQATGPTLDEATLVVGFAPEHVEWVRRTHPRAAARTATLKRLCRDLPATPEPLGERVTALEVASVELEPWEEVVDPGGQEVDAYIACAHEISGLIDRFVELL